MADYIGELPEDFDPNDYDNNQHSDCYSPWDFDRKEMEEGELTSKYMLNLIKRHPR